MQDFLHHVKKVTDDAQSKLRASSHLPLHREEMMEKKLSRAWSLIHILAGILILQLAVVVYRA